MLLNDYHRRRALMLHKHRQTTDQVLSLVPVHSYQPFSINLQHQLVNEGDQTKIVNLTKEDYVLVSDEEVVDVDDGDDVNDEEVVDEEEVVDGKEVDIETTPETKVVLINGEESKDDVEEEGEESEESKDDVEDKDVVVVVEGEESKDDVEDKDVVVEGEEGEEKEVMKGGGELEQFVQDGGDLIKNVVVTFF